jgi:hypothetical protein
MALPITEYLRTRGADFRFGVEVTRLSLGEGNRVRVSLAKAPDRTGVRHILVPGFVPAEPPDPDSFDAVVCTLPWERLLEVSRGDPKLSELDAWVKIQRLANVHPLTIRLWFERPIEGAEPRYILSSGTVFDVLRPTPERHRYDDGVHLVDALIESVEHAGLPYSGERLLDRGREHDLVMGKVLADLERLYPGQIRDNPVKRRFVHVREGILACHPGVNASRAPQHTGLPGFALGGDWTRQPWGVCMEGAVRSGQMAVEALLLGRDVDPRPWAFRQVAYSVWSILHRS